MTNKMTYAMALDTAIATVAEGEVRDKLIALKESLAKKSSKAKKPTANQKENAELKTAILDAMESGKAYTITELMKSIPSLAELSNQRVSAIVRQMKDANLVTREEIKRKAYFTKVEE